MNQNGKKSAMLPVGWSITDTSLEVGMMRLGGRARKSDAPPVPGSGFPATPLLRYDSPQLIQHLC